MFKKPVKRILIVCSLVGLMVFGLALYPRDWEKLYEEGLEYLNKNEFEKARDLLEEAYELNPKSADVLFHLAVASANIKTQWGYRGPRQSEANTYFNKVLELDPNYSLAHYQMGMMFYRREFLGKARKFFKRSQTIYNPNIDEAYYMASLCEARGKKLRFAKKEAMEALALRPTEPYYHKLLKEIDRKITERPNLYHDFYKGHNINEVKDIIDSSDDPQKIAGALHHAQYSKNQELVFDRVVSLLRHADRNVRMEATEYFLRQTEKSLRPFLTMYSLVTDTDLKWRLLYIFSEKFPGKAVREAKQILGEWEEKIKRLSPQEAAEPTILEMLSLRIIAKQAPEDLAAISSRPELWQPYEKILALYTGE